MIKTLIVVDRESDFNPSEFFGEEWVHQYTRNHSRILKVVDFDDLRFETYMLNKEDYVSYEVKVHRIGFDNAYFADAKIGAVLCKEKGQRTLNRLYEETGVSLFEMLGTTLRYVRDDTLATPTLFRDQDGIWKFSTYWNFLLRYRQIPCLVVEKKYPEQTLTF